MSIAIDKLSVANAYKRWAPVYDLVFGAVFEKGRRAVIAAANEVGGRILEIGIGTGISLPDYAPDNRIVGIDIAPEMLEKARQRVAALHLTNVERLEVMDAEHLAFPDASFDAVVANLVVSTVPHPVAALDECARVLRPGGELILLNRVGADAGSRRIIERLLQPVVQRLGWRSEFPWANFTQWLERRLDMHLAERRPVPPLGHFAVLRFVRLQNPPMS
jgi:phosphatidylethanolamine/phosphatidyl-N-methylethanolamine N-methyltransferase